MSVQSEIQKAEQLVLAGKLDQGRSICANILKRQPGNVGASHVMGAICVMEKRYAEGEKLLRRVLAAQPENIHALNNLGVLYYSAGDMPAAEAFYKKVVKLAPGHRDALSNLGGVCFRQRRLAEAEAFYRRALEADPDNLMVLGSLGVILADTGRLDEAVGCYRRALALKPQDPFNLSNLLRAEFLQGKVDEASRLARQLALLPETEQGTLPAYSAAPAYSVAKKLCLWDIAERLQPLVLRAAFDGSASQSDLSSCSLDLLSAQGLDNATLLDLHRALGRKIDESRGALPFADHPKAMASTERLRIGYISPDFRAHVVSSFIRGPINFYDKNRFEVYCYSNTKKTDRVTEQYRHTVDGFVDITGMSDLEAAQRIRDDGIHILVDLAGYTTDSRIELMAYRPAPMQVTYLGYPYTSGMAEVDYIIADPYLAGPQYARYCTEKPLLLEQSAFCFGDFPEQKIDPVIPLERKGHLTFGTLINPYKVNPDTLRVWSRILEALPEARLVMNHPSLLLEESRRQILAEFARYGVSGERVDLIWQRHPEGSHLRYYNDLDIALDTFPMTGGTTSTEAAWMGVPMVTLVGDSHSERITYSILKNLPLATDDLIAFGEDEYVAKAIALARNPDRIRELHRTIPEALKDSVLHDPILFARHMEAAYVDGWNAKFPDHGVQEIARNKPVLYAPVAGVELALPDSLEDVHSYVLREQGEWYDAEYAFVLRAIKAGSTVFDVGAALGMYAVPLARRIGADGKLLAITTPGAMYSYLDLSKHHNRLDNLEIVQANGLDVTLDDCGSGWDEVDFVRLSPETNDGKGGIAAKWRGLFAATSPLVLCAIRRGAEVDLSAAEVLTELGYGLYRLIPGLEALVPYRGPEDLDLFALNLIACKPQRAAALEQDGLLLADPQPLTEIPPIDATDWRDYLARFPYGAAIVESGIGESVDEWSDVYRVALNLFARFADARLDLNQRYACLETATSSMASLVATAPSFPRLMTLARVLTEAGKRNGAVNALNQLAGLLGGGGSIQLDEPFLAVSRHFEEVDPQGRLPDWIITSIYEQRERLRAFSSYFTGQESLALLAPMEAAGFLSRDMCHRLGLVRARHG